MRKLKDNKKIPSTFSLRCKVKRETAEDKVINFVWGVGSFLYKAAAVVAMGILATLALGVAGK